MSKYFLCNTQIIGIDLLVVYIDWFNFKSTQSRLQLRQDITQMRVKLIEITILFTSYSQYILYYKFSKALCIIIYIYIFKWALVCIGLHTNNTGEIQIQTSFHLLIFSFLFSQWGCFEYLVSSLSKSKKNV